MLAAPYALAELVDVNDRGEVAGVSGSFNPRNGCSVRPAPRLADRARQAPAPACDPCRLRANRVVVTDLNDINNGGAILGNVFGLNGPRLRCAPPHRPRALDLPVRPVKPSGEPNDRSEVTMSVTTVEIECAAARPAVGSRIGALGGLTFAVCFLLRERWSGWRREPFTGESTTHISVWDKLDRH